MHALPGEAAGMTVGRFALVHGGIAIDLIGRVAERAGRVVPLSPIEFSLLAFLIRAGGRPASRAALLRGVWQLGFDPGTDLVERHIARLGAKLDHGFARGAIETVAGEGYRIAG